MKFKTTITDDEFFNTHIRGTTRIIGRVLGEDDFSNIPSHVLEEAGRRGAAVHEAIEHFSNTGEHKQLKIEYQPYYEQFKLWYEKYQPEIIGAELKILSEKLGFKGVIDNIYIIDNKLVMCDTKTSGNLNMTKVTLQLNMYLLLLKESGLLEDTGHNIDELRVLQLGKTKFKYIKVDIDENYVHAVLQLYRLKVKHNE